MSVHVEDQSGAHLALLDKGGACAFLRVSRRTLYRLIARNYIKRHPVFRSLLLVPVKTYKRYSRGS